MSVMSNDHTDWFDALGKPVSYANLGATLALLVEHGVPKELAEVGLPIVARDIEHDNPHQATKDMQFLVRETIGKRGTETLVIMALATMVAPTSWPYIPIVSGRTCAICAGPVRRRTDVAARDGMENSTYPFLHVREEDWQDSPHHVELSDR